MFGLPVLAAALAGIAAALFAGYIVRPQVRLSARVRPYTAAARSMLGRSVDVTAVMPSRGGESTVARLFAPPLLSLADKLGRLIDATSEDGVARRLRQAGLLQNVPAATRVQEYRVRQLLLAATGGSVGFLVAIVTRRSAALTLLSSVIGFVGGAAYWRGKVDGAIEDRSNRMRIELYTINQLLAMRIRVGGGVVSAVRGLTERGHGAIIDELGEALRLHQSGMPAGAAFRRIAALTPEPHARRCYQVLATADERGSDLAGALLALSEDIRDDRQEAMRRQATRRRAVMLIPIIAILAPILILFVAAPLPWIVLRGLG
ncbi:MAG TPA: type II secretion system F family protein [Acidimicrobiia bacterium]|jgi:Flp pilus assembly protein TadB